MIRRPGKQPKAPSYEAPADAILTADWHLREDRPACRTDDYFAAQTDKLTQIQALQCEHGCPVLVSGDIFHHWKPSPWLLGYAIDLLREFPEPVYAIPGQHDLPQHSLSRLEESGLVVLAKAGVMRVFWEPGRAHVKTEYGITLGITGIPFGEPLRPNDSPHRSIALVHRLVYPGQPPFPGAEKTGGNAKSLLKEMKGFDLVVSGDNHETFVWSSGPEGAPLLANPGSLMRSTAKQENHKPGVFLYWAEPNTVAFHPLRYNEGAVSRGHIDQAQAKDKRLEAFVRRLGDDYEVSLSFEDNLRRFLAANPVRQPVEALLWELLEEKP